MNAPGIYLHLAFCPYLCPYCDFAKRPWRASEAQRYLAALEAEIARAQPVPAATLFVGGGTPNTYDPQTLAGLVQRVRSRFDLPEEAEITVEINPDPARAQGFQTYRAAGVTRLSIGVQSFDAAELRTLGRRHRPEDVERSVSAARAAGIADLSLDLIFGVPGQTRRSWRRSLEEALRLEPDHLSTYGLTVEEGTPYWAWREREPQAFLSSDDEAELYAMAIDLLSGHGYEQYELSNFARPGHRCRHNENYWRSGEYLGFGLGAASHRGGIRRANTRDFGEYCAAALGAGEVPADEEQLDPQSRLGEAMMLALRTADGVNLQAFGQRFRVDVLHHYAGVVADMREGGFLQVDPERITLTERGRFLANDVCAAFLSLPARGRGAAR